MKSQHVIVNLVNWAACKADPVHKMGRLVSKNEHYQLLTQYPKGRWVIHKPCLSIFEIDSVLKCKQYTPFGGPKISDKDTEDSSDDNRNFENFALKFIS